MLFFLGLFFVLFAFLGFCASLPLCFSASLASLLFCFSPAASLIVCFAVLSFKFLLAALPCFTILCYFLVFVLLLSCALLLPCFSASLVSLLFCFSDCLRRCSLF